MSDYFKWLIRILVWIKECWTWEIVAVSVVPISFTYSYLFTNNLEQTIRYSGLMLEILGLTTIVIGIVGTQRLFKKPGYFEELKERISRFPKFVDKKVVITGSSSTIAASASSKADAIIVKKPETLQERVEYLEKRISELTDITSKHSNEISQEINARKKSISEESSARAEADDRIEALLSQSLAGGFVLEGIGLFWITFGLIFATASAELSIAFTPNNGG